MVKNELFSNLFGQSEIMNMMPTIITVNKCRFQTKIQLMLLHHSTYILTTALLTYSQISKLKLFQNLLTLDSA